MGAPGLDSETWETREPEKLPLAALHGFLGFGGAGGWDFGNLGFDGADVEPVAQLGVELGEDVLVLLEEGARVFAALADAFAWYSYGGERR